LNSRERMQVAMRLGQPDRVPVMCQLALGHYFLHAGIDPIETWHSTEGFGEALIKLQRRYGFDGILVNLPGRDPNWRNCIDIVQKGSGERIIHWKNGWKTTVPPDDLPHVYRDDGSIFHANFAEIDPEKLFYAEPYDLLGLTYPYSDSLNGEPAPLGQDFFPAWQFDTLKYVLARVGNDVSVHSEIFSPFSQFMELLDYTNGLMALMDDPGKVRACLDALAEGAIALGRGQAETGAHAILISSAFAGAGFISRAHYGEFVLPYERKVIAGIKAEYDIPIYTHTCGAIGDRLDLMEQTGANGIDTLDPPPLGTVELAEAKREIGGRMFIRGNVDPVNVVLMGKPRDVLAAARRCVEIAAPGGGYILSTACSVAPQAPPENIMQLRVAVDL
jgi:hypothetical protein